MQSDIFLNFSIGVLGRNPATVLFYVPQRSVASSAASTACVGKATART